MKIIGDIFSGVMYVCYEIMHNYGLAIILFTLMTKIILLPISVMVQMNSIKMVKMYPEINHIKAVCYGNRDMISEEEYNLYKREHYHPMLDLIPVILQLIILMGVVDGVRRLDVADKVFLSLDFGIVPVNTGGISIIIPFLAALSSWLMCFAQNKASVLQSQQGRANKLITMLVSVGLSLYLGFFVPGGVGLYWISNLMSIIVMYSLNYFINPRKYIDYEALEKSKKELEEANQFTTQTKSKEKSEHTVLEKQDYKRFLKYENKQLVFYSEKMGFINIFRILLN